MERQSRGRLLWSLFAQMLLTSAFTFGGGFVIVSLMKKRFVDERHWLDEQEMLDMTALAQSLRKEGMPLPEDLLTVDEMAEEVCKLLCPSK